MANLNINVRMSTSARFTIGDTNNTITSSSTVLQLKQAISKEEASGNCEVGRQRLIYKGRILSDDTRTLSDYGIVEDNQTIHLVKGSAPSSTGSASQSVPSSNSAPSVTTGTGSTNFGAFGGNENSSTNNANATNPFFAMQQMMNSSPGGGLPDMSQMQQQLLQNPEMMSNIMNSPMVQNLMSNPDFIRSMMETNPQMRQVLESNPELRNLLDDPDFMRRSMEMMRDPGAMQNMMRNQDLAMSQIENIPGGFSALRRMYEDVQEPMMDAMSGGNGGEFPSSSSGSSSNANQNSGAAGAAMPNPWGSTPSNTNTVSSGTTPSSTTTSTTPASTPFNPWGSGGGTAPNPWGGGGIPNMNLEQTISMLENPMINQMMTQMMADPAAMQQIMENNPMLRQMRETNPEAAAMMSNPETMRTMMNPENLRAMLQMQNAMQQLGQNIPGFPPVAGMGVNSPGGGMNQNPSSISTTVGANNGMDFSSLLNQFQATSVSGNSFQQRQQMPPEQRFRMQLQSMNDMGFDDNVANLQALSQTHGNVNRAVDVLLMGPPTSSTSNNTAAAPASEVLTNPNGNNESSTGSNDASASSEDGPKDKKND